jgi:hypothetical protein
MRTLARAAALVALCMVVGCAQTPASSQDGETQELSTDLKSLVLDQAPTDIPQPLYLDFNGRAELLGYALEPSGTAAPGSQVSLKLYWRSTRKLDPGFLPFTELVTPDGTRVEVEGTGPVRKGQLIPQNWVPRKVYVDELSFTVPKDLDAARFSIVVGLKSEPVAPEAPAEPAEGSEKKAEKPAEGSFGQVYLSVLSGPADQTHGGIVATLETGITSAKRARAGKDKGVGPAKRMPGAPTSAKPRPAASAK